MIGPVEIFKKNHVDPYIVEKVYDRRLNLKDSYDIKLRKFLGKEAYEVFHNMAEEELKRELIRVYYPEIPSFSRHTAEFISDVRLIARYESKWRLIQNWLKRIADTEEEWAMVDYIDTSKEKALKVYGYLLYLDIQEYETQLAIDAMARKSLGYEDSY